jgi:hypothetical protein
MATNIRSSVAAEQGNHAKSTDLLVSRDSHSLTSPPYKTKQVEKSVARYESVAAATFSGGAIAAEAIHDCAVLRIRLSSTNQ